MNDRNYIGQHDVLVALRQAIVEVESGRARGCFVACFGPEPEDKFSISACEPSIRDTVIAEAEELLASIRAAHSRKLC